MTIKCGVCGTTFEQKRVDNHYCSKKCRRRAYVLYPKEKTDNAEMYGGKAEQNDCSFNGAGDEEIDLSYKNGVNYMALKAAIVKKNNRKVCVSCVWGFSGVCIMPSCSKRI